MKRLSYALITLLISLGTSFAVVPAVAHADFKDDACKGVTQIEAGGCSANTGKAISGLLKIVINVLSIIVGFAAVVMVIFGGFKYITAAGDSSKLANARTTILYALIGLVIVVLAQVLVYFTLAQANKARKTTVIMTSNQALSL